MTLLSTDFFNSGEFYSFACAAVWAIAVVLFRKSGELLPPVVLNLFKNSVGLLLLLLTLAIAQISFFPVEASARDWFALLLSGLVGVAIADSLVFAALNRLGAGGQAIVDCLYSPLVILIAYFYLGESLHPILIVAMMLILGAIFVGMGSVEASQQSRLQRKDKLYGVALGSLAMLLMAAAIVFIKPVLAHVDAWWATTVRMAGAMPLLMIQGLSRRHRHKTFFAFKPGAHWWVLIPGTVLGAYVALLLWLSGYQKTSAGVAGLLNQSSTIMIMLLATVFLKERLTGRRFVAILMGFAGAALVLI